MSNLLAQRHDGLVRRNHVGRVILAEDERPDGSATVRAAGDGPGALHSAIVAVSRAQPLGAGDEALVIGTPDEQLYIVGVVAPPDARAGAGVLAAAGGAYATTNSPGEEADAERLRVYSPRNELLFEYDSASGRALVNVPRGGLALRTEEGDIELQSAGAVRIQGQEVGLTAERLEVRATHTRWIADKVETIAETVMEKVKNAYRSVEHLTQLRTGRMRTLVEESYQFRSKNAYVKAEKDYKIKADQIQLG